MTTVLDVFGPTSDDCSASANNICQFTPLISVSPNSNEDQLCSKHDLFLVESVHDESFQRSSPSSFKTPSKEVSSPGSLELPSMPSDKSSSRDCSDGHSSVNFLFSSDLTDTDRSNSVCSLSPSTQPTEHFSNANDEFFLLCPDRMLESAFVRSVGADMDDNRAVSNKIPDGITDIQTPLNTPLQNSCSNDGNYSAFTSLAYNESETTQYKYHDAPSRPDCPQPIGTNTYPTIMTASYVLPSKVGVKVDSCVSKVGGIFTVCDQSTTFPESSTCLLKSPDSSATFNSRHLSDFCQSSENTPDCIRSRGNSVLVPDSFARRRGESKLLYDQNDTDFQTSKPTCSPKTVDPHTTRFDPINIKNKYISNDFSHQRVPVITGPERTTTFASGKRSRNAYSSPCILPLKGRNCHAESKLLSNYGHMYKTTVVSVTSYPPYSLDQNMAPSRDSITLTKRKTFINNWDSRHNWRNNDINPVTKIDYSSVPGFQDSSASKSKRKGSRVVGRGGKRHKSLDSEIHSCRTNQTPSNVSLHSLLLQDVSRFIQDPVLRPLLHLYAPTPLPPCSQPNFSTSISDLASLGQKYFRFPMSLRKLKDKPIAEENILRFLARCPNTKERINYLNQENFLVDAYRRSLGRNFYSTYLSPTPENRVSPLNLFNVHKFHITPTVDCITPPLSPVVSDDFQCCLSELNDDIKCDHKYPEEIILFDQLVSEAQKTCFHCKMQIILPKKPLMWKSQDKDSCLSFCSSGCLMELKRQGTSYITPSIPNNNCDFTLSVTSTNESQPITVFLIKNSNNKRVKQASRRPSLQDMKTNHRRNTNDVSHNRSSLGIISSLKRWRNIRWRRHIDTSLVCARNSFQKFSNAPVFIKNYSLSNKCLGNDTRVCHLCHQKGDGSNDVTSRLLNYSADKWLHLNCILWCYETYETVSGSLMDVSRSLKKALKTPCTYCKDLGAGLPCFHSDCEAVYHLPCAHQIDCSFHPDRGMYCPLHCSSANHIFHLESLAVERKVYISRDEHSQVERIISDEDYLGAIQNTKEPRVKLRIGTLVLHRIGQLLPEQLASGFFHTTNHIYPVGYWSTRFYWSFRHVGRRCRYDCRIEDVIQSDDKDQSHVKSILIKFTVEVIEPNEENICFEDSTCDGVWQKILSRINLSRKRTSSLLRILQSNIHGEVLFGLTEPHIIRAIESLPGVDRLSNYLFKFGKLQLIQEMPLAINPTGCARSEPKLRTYVRRKPAGELNSCPWMAYNHVILESPGHSYSLDVGSPTHLNSQSSNTTSKSQQYRRLRREWRTNVVLARSRIQGLGLYAARDINKSTFIIEYLGEIIRNEVANRRERLYESQNRGIYMFRVDDDWIVDATMCGGLARYINHSCDPNCTAEILNCDNSNHIVIIANKNIEKGDELTYDYKFDLEEDRWDRIPCLCGSANCRKWMN